MEYCIYFIRYSVLENVTDQKDNTAEGQDSEKKARV